MAIVTINNTVAMVYVCDIRVMPVTLVVTRSLQPNAQAPSRIQPASKAQSRYQPATGATAEPQKPNLNPPDPQSNLPQSNLHYTRQFIVSCCYDFLIGERANSYSNGNC